MQCLKKLCHDSCHKISFHLIYVDSIFDHNFLCQIVSCHLYHFYLFAFRFALCALPNGSNVLPDFVRKLEISKETNK